MQGSKSISKSKPAGQPASGRALGISLQPATATHNNWRALFHPNTGRYDAAQCLVVARNSIIVYGLGRTCASVDGRYVSNRSHVDTFATNVSRVLSGPSCTA